jgi:hypothetical protein
MQFELDGQKYKFRFHYSKEVKRRAIPLRNGVMGQSMADGAWGGPDEPNRKVTVVLDDTYYKTCCTLESLAADGTTWTFLAVQYARCSLKDHYHRKEGRAAALGKMVQWAMNAESNQALADSLQSAWKNRSRLKTATGKHS